MTQQEIQALIDAKIKGQGTAIDAGSALPPILTGLNEMAGKAVSPDSTDMSEADQMAVRKNLGLYYETPEEDNTVQYDGNPDGKELYKDGALVRLSENIPSEADILAVDKNGEEITATFETIGDNDSFLIKDESISIFVIIAGEETGDYEGLPTGIYGYTAHPEYALTYKVADAYVGEIPERFLPEGTRDAVRYVPQELTAEQQSQARTNIGAGTSNFNGNPVLVTEQELTETQQMQARKNQDLYYSDVETQEVEKTFYRDTAFEAQGTDDFVLVSKPSAFTYNFLYRFLNDTPQAEDIVQVYNDGWVAGTPTIVTESGYIVIDSGILVVYEDNKQITWEGQSVTLDKGIWAYMYDYLYGAGGDGYNGIKYNETTETVHKVPATYLPLTTNLSAQSTDLEAPTAKTVYDFVKPAVESSQPNGGFLPNVVYDLGTLTGAVTFALASPTDNTIANPYHWTFETGSTAPTVDWPANVTWLEGSEPTIDASCHYEIMIRNGYGTYLKFEIS